MVTPPHAPRSVYVGLFLVTLARIVYEIALTRIFSVTMWYHFAFVAVSIAMFGMTVGALLVFLLPRLFDVNGIRTQLAVASALYPVLLVLSFLTELSVPFLVHPSVIGLYSVV